MTEDDQEQPASPRAALLALVTIAVLVGGGLWLSHVLGNAASVQDCMASGRTNCAPVHTN